MISRIMRPHSADSIQSYPASVSVLSETWPRRAAEYHAVRGESAADTTSNLLAAMRSKTGTMGCYANNASKDASDPAANGETTEARNV